MRIHVIYDSVYGNTKRCAQEIAATLEDAGDVLLVAAAEFDTRAAGNAELIVLGSPTRGFRPTTAARGIVTAFDRETIRRTRVALFDTRIALEEIPVKFVRRIQEHRGYAAQQLAAKVIQRGGTVIGEPLGLLVEASEGPLKEGELERAAQWAAGIVRLASEAGS